MLQDSQLFSAVTKWLQRSEKQEDVEKLMASFVDAGIIPTLDNRNNQILYGRRGTGKTHAFRVLAQKLVASNTIVSYIDARTLGSSTQFSDNSFPLYKRATALFRDIATAVAGDIFNKIAESDPALHSIALDGLESFYNAVTEPFVHKTSQCIEEREQIRQEGGVSGSIGLTAETLSLHSSTRKASEVETTRKFDVEEVDKLFFPDLHQSLAKILASLSCHLYLIIDEWSSLPLDLQPALAEFLKRAFLPLNGFTLKVASLEFRSSFGIQKETGILGFELGCDISTPPEMDDYFVYDRNPPETSKIFAEILYRHLSLYLPEDYLTLNCNIKSATQLPSRMFTERGVFDELVRAAEGVPRDFINLFTSSFVAARKWGRANIDKPAITEAAQDWYNRDKQQNLSEELNEALTAIIREIIGEKKVRSFLLEKKFERHPIIQKLFESRVLHVMKKGYSDKENPGKRYNIYTLDYGTYVDLQNTKAQIEMNLIIPDTIEEDSEVVVPFDDKRILRRTILDEEFLMRLERGHVHKR